MNIVIAASRLWDPRLADTLAARSACSCQLITRPEDLTSATLSTMAPRYVFFPHWSHRIPPAIFENYECVIFHMADLPFGRGGSPLQNLIVRGIYETQICALRGVAEIDAGPVYLRRPLSLHGNAQEIYLRASTLIGEMMAEMVATPHQPRPQTGEPVLFQRRTPADSNLAPLGSLRQVYDHIRMLDADGYPPAFVDVGPYRLEFKRAALSGESIQADVIIRERP